MLEHPFAFGLAFALLTACGVERYEPLEDTGALEDTGPVAVEDGEAPADADGGAGGGGGGSGGDPDPDRPAIEAADAWCFLHETGDTRWIWSATATASDPQGADTLLPVTAQGIAVYAGGGTYDPQVLVCDADGSCTASWGADEAGMDCARPQDFTLVFTVLDEDAKRSVPFEVTGRLGSGPEG